MNVIKFTIKDWLIMNLFKICDLIKLFFKTKLYNSNSFIKHIYFTIIYDDFDSFKKLLKNKKTNSIINNIFQLDLDNKRSIPGSYTLLTVVCYMHDDPKWIKLILKKKNIDVNKRPVFRDTPLIIAIKCGSYNVAKHLINHPKIKLNIKFEFFETTYNIFKLLYTNRRVNFNINLLDEKYQNKSYELYKKLNYTLLFKSNLNEEYM